MKNRIISVLLLLTLIFSMMFVENNDNKSNGDITINANETLDSSDTSDSSNIEPTLVYNLAGGNPWIDSDLKENVSYDTVVDAKDDFHLYVNKEWILNNNIPDGYSSWGNYDKRTLDVRNQCIDLLKDESVEGHDAELIRTYNSLLLDWDTRNELGVSELIDNYNDISQTENIDDITELLTEKNKLGLYYEFVDYGACIGFNDPDTYICAVNNSSLFLQDSAEYFDRTEYGDMYYGFYKDLFVYIAPKYGMSENEASECFDKAIEFETKMAQGIYTTDEMYSEDIYDKINNEMSFDDMVDGLNNFPLDEIITKEGYKYDGIYLVYQPEYIKLLDQLYCEDNFESIKALITVRYVIDNYKFIDKDTYDKRNELDSYYFGVNGSISDEEMAYEMVLKKLPDSLQKVYVEKYGSEEDKERMYELCQEVIDTYKELITENDWASDEVKDYAIEKLNNMKIYVAYPDKFNDTSGINLDNCSLIEANTEIYRNLVEQNIKLLGSKIDKDNWANGMDITSCNAYYSANENAIYMVIGMMGEPFYSSDMSVEELYASIGGYFIGHEVSHAFDSNGAQFDADGYYRDWWTDKDKEEFNKRIDKVDEYLDSIIAFDGYNFVGANIDTEMVADISGLQCALRMASKVDNFDYKKFFIKYAEMNVSIKTYSEEIYALMQDVHPLDYSRTNVPVQQFEEFYEAFDIEEGDNMYLAPEDRIVVW